MSETFLFIDATLVCDDRGSNETSDRSPDRLVLCTARPSNLSAALFFAGRLST
jgi:hypothetical protein